MLLVHSKSFGRRERFWTRWPRPAVLKVVLIGWMGVLALRLVELQVLRHDQLLRLAQQQQEHVVEIQPTRGTLYDRTGHALAMSLPVDSVCVNPLKIKNVRVAAEILSRTLRLDENDLVAQLQTAIANDRGFLWIKRRVSAQESASLKGLNLEWVEFRPESVRMYPAAGVAAHVVGSVDADQKGNNGIEQGLEDELQGTPGTALVANDVKRHSYFTHTTQRMVPGRDVTLSIDQRLQYVAEQKLAEAVRENHCQTGTLVAMDPRTGDILAMASYPTFNPDDPVKPGESLTARNNIAVTVPFEPGSVFKVITLTAALETTRLTPRSPIFCGNGAYNFFGHVVHDTHRHGYLTMAEVLSQSSNIGAINIGITMGQEKLYEYITRFGFGRRTGVPLPGESPGQVRRLKAWTPTSISAVPMGQEVSVTSLQLAQACSVIANGGYLVKPRLVLKKERPGEDQSLIEPQRERIIQAKTAITMRQMMEGVVLNGTGKGTKLVGYTSGGKTGTAQIFDRESHKYLHKYNASFMGFAPLNDPKIVVVVTLSPASGMGAAVAGPAFKAVAQEALRVLDVPRDLPDDLLPTSNEVPLQLVSHEKSKDEAEPAPEPIGPPQREDDRALAGPKVPDFRGKTLKAVLHESTAQSLPVEFVGSGVVRAQWPEPGRVLGPGQKIRVQFSH